MQKLWLFFLVKKARRLLPCHGQMAYSGRRDVIERSWHHLCCWYEEKHRGAAGKMQVEVCFLELPSPCAAELYCWVITNVMERGTKPYTRVLLLVLTATARTSESARDVPQWNGFCDSFPKAPLPL